MKRILPIFLITTILGFLVLSYMIPGVAKNTLKKRKELTLLLTEEKILPQAQQLLSSKSEQIGVLEEVFPTKEKLFLAVAYMDSQAVATGVQAQLHFESEEIIQDANGDSIVPVKISIEGAYSNILAFLAVLQKGKYFYTISHIEGEASGGLQGKNKVSVNANLYASN